jgi:hypothetical protein
VSPLISWGSGEGHLGEYGGVWDCSAPRTTPQPQNSDAPWVAIGRYRDAPSVGIELRRHLFAAAESGVAIAYADRHVLSDRLSDVLGAIYSDT